MSASLSDFEGLPDLNIIPDSDGSKSFLFSAKFWVGLGAIAAAMVAGYLLYKYYADKNMKREQMNQQYLMNQQREQQRAIQMQQQYNQ